MKNKKNNLKNYQEDKVANRLTLIEEQLIIYKQQAKVFKNITQMAELLSQHISKEENSSCSSSTILRNDNYKKLIENYFYSQEGIKKPGSALKLIENLTLSNLEKENSKLKQYIKGLEKELDHYKNFNSIDTLKNEPYLTTEESNLANMKKALNILINHFEGLVAINENGDLIDLTKKVNNIIIDKKLINKN